VPSVDYTNSDTGCKVTIELLRSDFNELDKSLGLTSAVSVSLSSASMSSSYDSHNYPASHGLSGSTTTAITTNGLGQWWKATMSA
jgi:hypothetical protein